MELGRVVSRMAEWPEEPVAVVGRSQAPPSRRCLSICGDRFEDLVENIPVSGVLFLFVFFFFNHP